LYIIIETIDTIPFSINPEVCGLNSNALFGYHTSLGKLLWTDMMKLYPSIYSIHDTNNDWDEVVQKTTEDILRTLPELFNIKKVKRFYGDKCGSPNIIFLLHELVKCNMLLEVMRNTLSQLAKVIVKHRNLYFKF